MECLKKCSTSKKGTHNGTQKNTKHFFGEPVINKKSPDKAEPSTKKYLNELSGEDSSEDEGWLGSSIIDAHRDAVKKADDRYNEAMKDEREKYNKYSLIDCNIITSMLIITGGKKPGDFKAEERESICACLLSDAGAGRSMHKVDLRSLRIWKFLHSKNWRILMYVIIFCQFYLTIFEHQIWKADNFVDAIAEHKRQPWCDASKIIADNFVLDTRYSLKPTTSLAIELTLLIPHVIDCFCWFKVSLSLHRDIWVKMKLMITFVTLFDIFLHLGLGVYFSTVEGSNLETSISSYFRISRIFRPFFLIFQMKSLRNSTLKIIASVKGIFSLIVVAMVLTSCVAAASIDIWPPAVTSTGEMYFSSVFKSIGSLSELMFGPNGYPDIELPSYTSDTRGSPIFFGIFLVVCNIFVLQQTLAIVFCAYTECNKAIILHDKDRKRTAVLIGFMMLDMDNDGRVYKDSYLSAVKKSRELLRLDKHLSQSIVDEQMMEFLETTIDEENKGYISDKKFLSHTTAFVGKQYMNRRDKAWLLAGDVPEFKAGWLNGGKFQKQLRPILLSSLFCWLIDIIVLYSIIHVFVVAAMIINPNNDDINGNTMNELWIEAAMTFCFTTEMVVTILGIGIHGYLRTPELFIHFILAVIQIVTFWFIAYLEMNEDILINHFNPVDMTFNRMNRFSPYSKLNTEDGAYFSPTSIVMLLEALRITRCVRLLRITRHYAGSHGKSSFIKLVIKTTTNILHKLTNIALYFFCVMFIFAVIGTQCFGGRFTIYNSLELQDTDYWQQGYDVYVWAQPKPKLVHGVIQYEWPKTSTESIKWPHDERRWIKITEPPTGTLSRLGKPFSECDRGQDLHGVQNEVNDMKMGNCYMHERVLSWLYGMNFNTVHKSVKLLIKIILVNDYTFVYDALIATSHDNSTKWMILFYILTVQVVCTLVLLNILISIFLDNYTQKLDEASNNFRQDKERLKKLYHMSNSTDKRRKFNELSFRNLITDPFTMVVEDQHKDAVSLKRLQNNIQIIMKKRQGIIMDVERPDETHRNDNNQVKRKEFISSAAEKILKELTYLDFDNYSDQDDKRASKQKTPGPLPMASKYILRGIFLQHGQNISVSRISSIIRISNVHMKKNGSFSVKEFIDAIPATLEKISTLQHHDIREMRKIESVEEQFTDTDTWIHGNRCRLCNVPTSNSYKQILLSILPVKYQNKRFKYVCYACLTSVCGSCSARRYIPNLCIPCIHGRKEHEHVYCAFESQRICSLCYNSYKKNLANIAKDEIDFQKKRKKSAIRINPVRRDDSENENLKATPIGIASAKNNELKPRINTTSESKNLLNLHEGIALDVPEESNCDGNQNSRLEVNTKDDDSQNKDHRMNYKLEAKYADI